MNSALLKKIAALSMLLLLAEALVTGMYFAYTAREQDFGWQAIVQGALWSVLLAIVLSLTAATFFYLRLAGRLGRISALVRRISASDFGARLHETRDSDEISQLEAGLNQAVAHLDEDFAELERGRHELAAMLDAMQEGVVAINPDGHVRWSNTVMQRLAGTEIRAGRSLVHSIRDPEFLACVRAALESREPRLGRATSIVPGRVFEVSAAPLPAGGALIVLHDLTSLEAAQASRREFVANVSHELRTPLTSIQGYVETILDDPSPDPEIHREFLGIILKNAARMNRLTEDLLALATVESPNYKLSLVPTPASALVKDAVQSMTAPALELGVDLDNIGAPDLKVMADAYALHQVFGNLIQNSLKYAAEGRRIEVGAEEIDGQVRFTVRDFGCGIGSEHLERIFERFYRVDKARSRESGGTGLGLAIVKHIVLAHGGRVWVESELGNGAAFRFTLPVALQGTADTPATAPA